MTVFSNEALFSSLELEIVILGRGTKSTGIKSTKKRNQPRNEVNPGIKSTREENQPEHEINKGGKREKNQPQKNVYFLKYFTF